MARSFVRGCLGWIFGKGSRRGCWALEEGPQRSGHSMKPGTVQEVFEQCSQVYGVTFRVGPMQGQVSGFQWSLLAPSYYSDILRCPKAHRNNSPGDLLNKWEQSLLNKHWQLQAWLSNPNLDTVFTLYQKMLIKTGIYWNSIQTIKEKKSGNTLDVT